MRKKKGAFDSIKCKRYHCKRLMVFSLPTAICFHSDFSLYIIVVLYWRWKKKYRGKMPSITIKTILPFAIPSKIIIFIRRFLFLPSTHSMYVSYVQLQNPFNNLNMISWFIELFYFQRMHKMVAISNLIKYHVKLIKIKSIWRWQMIVALRRS